jgi:broad specificity phosphatase PhoE
VVAKRLKDEDIGVIISSDLKRAKQTAKEINKFHNIEIILDSRLRDILNNEELEDFVAKCNHALGDIEKLDKNAIVVAHESSCLTFLVITTGNREEGGKIVREHQNKHENTCVSVVEKEGNKYNIKFIGCKKHLDR